MMGLFAKLFGLGPKSAIDHNNRRIAYGEKGEYTIVEGPLIPTNGSFFGYYDEICWMCKLCHPKPVHGGTQSMDIFYSNTGGALYSEAIRTCSHAQDWTEHGVDILSPWFYGDPNNAPEPIYVTLSNSTGTAAAVFHDDPGAATIDTWTEWEVDLKDFADQGGPYKC